MADTPAISRFMATDEQKREFSLALRAARMAADLSQQRLSDLLSDHVDRRVPQETYSAWDRGVNTPQPSDLFALEEILRVPPGSLSRHLGFLPVDVVEAPPADTVTAVRQDRALERWQQDIIINTYESFISGSSRRTR